MFFSPVLPHLHLHVPAASVLIVIVLFTAVLRPAPVAAETTQAVPALANLVDGPEGIPGPKIVDRLLPDKCSRPRPTTATVSRVMLHFTSAVMVKPEDPFNVDAVLDIFTNYTVSAHYLVDRDGTVYRLVPEDRTAFHAGRGRLPGPPYFENSLNDHSIGIEIMAMGSARDMLPFMSPSRHAELMAKNPHWFGYTDAQYASLRALLAEILRQFPGIAPDRMHIIGHDEYAPGRKTDPGETFDYTQLGLAQKPPADWVHPPSAD